MARYNEDRIEELEKRVKKLESDFASHFHGADELLGTTDEPIVPVEAAEASDVRNEDSPSGQ